MTEAEARAYLSAQLPELRAPCPRSKDAFMKGLPLGDTMHWYDPKGDGGWPCTSCGGTGAVARDWHVWEDLLPAMEKAGWNWEAANREDWEFSRYSRPPMHLISCAYPNPIIAAALALQQEAKR